MPAKCAGMNGHPQLECVKVMVMIFIKTNPPSQRGCVVFRHCFGANNEHSTVHSPCDTFFRPFLP